MMNLAALIASFPTLTTRKRDVNTIMRSIAWVTDSTSTIDPDFAKENHIYIVPLRLILGQEEYREGIDISAEAFMKE